MRSIGTFFFLRSLLFLALATLVGSCATLSSRTSKDVYQSGIASWYGAKFQGRPTASGERFNMKDLTAAHRTLPFGQIIRVTSLSTGRSVDLRINDRGPFHSSRILDMSYAAAVALDIVNKGEDSIEIRLVTPRLN